nr:uncharacterized protein DDB_G0271670 [Halyomorpha halys]
MISVIAFLLVSGCACAPSGNTTSSSSSSSSSSVSSSSNGGNGVITTITQKFSSSSGVPNITSALGNAGVSHISSSIFSSADQTAAAIQNQTKQTFAAIQKQNQASFSVANNMASSINQAVQASHLAFKNSFKTMFRPMSIFSSSPFFV